MPRESKTAKRTRALLVCERMDERYPEARSALNFSDPFTLTISVLLSAQTTDRNVNAVTPELFARYGTPELMAAARAEDIEEIIHSIGLYRSKARHCVELARLLVDEYGGEVPADIDELQKLPGVGRKTANIVMNEGFGIVEGIAVDTHVFRIAHKLRLTKAGTPGEVEKDLLDLIPREKWGPVNRQWVLFGREVCTARNPRCATCELSDICPSSQV